MPGTTSERPTPLLNGHALRRTAPSLAAVGSAFPGRYYDQETLTQALRDRWGGRLKGTDRLDTMHRRVRVGGRHLALSIPEYDDLKSLRASNDAFIRCALELGEQAIGGALDQAGLDAKDVDHLFFVSVTGLATPSVDARLVNRMGLRHDVKRTPVFGLGCVAGAAGVARAADYLRAFPEHVAVLLSVELCSLTIQWNDLSIRNLIASGLFGDGAAAVVLSGAERSSKGPTVLASASNFYPDTEHLMGWDIGDEGFRLVLSADVPDVIRKNIRPDVERFLASHGLGLDDIATWVCHSGGPRILEACQESLGITEKELHVTWSNLERVGNLSSASVLVVLQDTLRERAPAPGSRGLMMGMGPGFCSELVLLEW